MKEKTPADLVSMAEELGVEGASTMRRQDLMFCILRELAEDEEYEEKIMGIGTIEVMQDGSVEASEASADEPENASVEADSPAEEPSVSPVDESTG